MDPSYGLNPLISERKKVSFPVSALSEVLYGTKETVNKFIKY
jgi:hypothetical protein